MSPNLSVVLGASGGLGAAVVRALAREGRPVRAVSRSGTGPESPGVEWLAADLSDRAAAVTACAGAAVVVNAVQPPYDRWAELFPPLIAGVLAGAEAAGAKLVMVDNLYMYGPAAGELTEDTPRRATGTKGALRIRIEDELLAAHAGGRVRVTIGRLSDYYGVGGANSSLVKTVLEPAVKGRTMRWLGSLDQPRTLHYLDDAARGLLVLADQDLADGQVWHLPAAAPITGRSFTALVNGHLEDPVKVATMSRLALRIGGLFSAPARETVEVFHQWDRPFVSSSAKFDAAFGPIQVTPHDQALAPTLAWLRTT